MIIAIPAAAATGNTVEPVLGNDSVPSEEAPLVPARVVVRPATLADPPETPSSGVVGPVFGEPGAEEPGLDELVVGRVVGGAAVVPGRVVGETVGGDDVVGRVVGGAVESPTTKTYSPDADDPAPPASVALTSTPMRNTPGAENAQLACA